MYNYSQSYYQNPYQFMPQAQPQQIQQSPQQQQFLNGKLVDSIQVVKATEVPIGGYGIFPKADLSQLYIKTWGLNGTTAITVFKPYIQPKTQSPTQQPQNNQILNKIKQLQEKLDTIINLNLSNTKPAATKRKETSANEF